MSLSGRIVVNISHGTAQQSIHDFVMYVAKLRGLKRGEHYTFRREQGTRVFRLTPKGVVNLGGRRAPNGLYYTHQLKRRSHFQSCNRDLELANDRFNGEAYLDAWFLNDASEFFQEVKRECRLRTNNPEEILQFVKSDPQLAAELEKKGFNWTKGEGYIIGIEMSAKPTRTDEGCEEGYGHYDGFFGEEQETRGDSSCVNRCKDDDGDIPEDDIPF
jgi:hypothetical protein